MAAITLDIAGNTRQLDRDIQKTVNRVYAINLKTKGDQPLGRITGQVNEFNKSLDASNARVIAFGASAGIIFGVERAFAALVSSVIDVQKSLQDINVILNASQTRLQAFGAELFSIARNTGQSFQEVAKAATEFSRQGLGVEETLRRTNEALILSRLSGLDAAKSVEALTAAVNSYASQAVTASEVVNKFANVDAAFAVSSADLAEALARVGSSAAQSGVSLNELIAIVTSAQQTTARGGAVIGNSFKTIFTRLQREKVVDLLESLGISSTDGAGQIKSTIQLLQDLGAVYDTLGSQQQAYVAEQVGGVFQINILKAALADLGKEYSIYSSALNVAASTTDQAIRRNEELNQTYAAQINALKENARQLAASAGERLLGPSINRLVGGSNQLLEGINESDGQNIGSVLGKGILDGLGQFIAGPGLALIGGVLLKLFRDLGKFAVGSAQQLLGLNTAAAQQRDLQQSISQILAKNPQLLQLALQGEQGLNQAANQLLTSLQKQTVELQKQAQVATQISKAFVAQAGVRVAGGIPVAPTKPTKASGYIPNFALGRDKIAETVGAYQAGYEPGRIFSKRLFDGQGGSFMATVNGAESINTVVGPNGNKGTFVTPPNAAKGYVPNFIDDLKQFRGNTPGSLSNTLGGSLNDLSKKERNKIINFRQKYGYLLPPGFGRGSLSGSSKLKIPPGIRFASPDPRKIKTFSDGNEKKEEANLEAVILNNVAKAVSQYTNTLQPLGTQVDEGRIKAQLQSNVIAGAKGALKSITGSGFEIGITEALGYEAAVREKGGDFDVRGGTALGKVQELFGLNAPLMDFKVSLSRGNTDNFYDKVLKEEGLKGAEFGPTEQKENARALAQKQIKDKYKDDFQKEGFQQKIGNPPELRKKIEEEFQEQIRRNQNRFVNLGSKRGRSSGYIPNFELTNQINDAINREVSAGIPENQIYLAQEKALTSANPMGMGVFNKLQEPNKKTRKQAMRQKGFSSGYVPNFAITDTDVQAADTASSLAALAAQVTAVGFAFQFSKNEYTDAIKKFEQETKKSAGAVKKFTTFLNTNALGLSIAGPIIAETISNAIGRETAGSRRTSSAVSAVGQIGSFAATGALIAPGPVGAGIGAAVGALLTLPTVIEDFVSEVPELKASAVKAQEGLTKINDSGSAFLRSYENYTSLLEQGASQDVLNKAQQEYARNLFDVSDEYRNRLSDAAKLGKAQEELAKILDEEAKKRKGSESAVTFGDVLKDLRVEGLNPFDFETEGLDKATDEGKKRFERLFSTLSDELTFGKSNQEILELSQNLRDLVPKDLIVRIKSGDVSSIVDDLPQIKESLQTFVNELVKTGSISEESGNQLNQYSESFKRNSDITKRVLPFLLLFGDVFEDIGKKAQNSLDETKGDNDATTRYLKSLDEARSSINRTVEAIQTNIQVQNLWKSAIDRLNESSIGFENTLKISDKFTNPQALVESIIGQGSNFGQRLEVGGNLATIEESQRSAISNAAINFSETILSAIEGVSQKNIDKLVEDLTKIEESLGKDPDKIQAEADKKTGEILQEEKKLNQSISSVENLISQFVSDQIDSQQFLQEITSSLDTVGINIKDSGISSKLETALAKFNIDQISEAQKAFQQRKTLAKESTQKILQQKIAQSLGAFGGAEEFLKPTEGGLIFPIEATIKSIEPLLKQSLRGTQAGTKKDPTVALGRESLKLITGLRTLSGGSFTADPSGEAFNRAVSGRAVDIQNQISAIDKLIAQQAKIGKPGDLAKSELEAFKRAIESLGGSQNISELQIAQAAGSLSEKKFADIIGRFQSPALEALKKIDPQLAELIAETTDLSTNDPSVKSLTTLNTTQARALRELEKINKNLSSKGRKKLDLKDIEGINAEISNSETNRSKKNTGPSLQPYEIEAQTIAKRDQKYLQSPSALLNPSTGKNFESIIEVEAEMQKAFEDFKTGFLSGVVPPEELKQRENQYNILRSFRQSLNPTESTPERAAMLASYEENLPRNPNSPNEIEKRTVAARDQKRFETWSKAGGMGLGPLASEDRFGVTAIQPESRALLSKDMIPPTLMATNFGEFKSYEFSPSLGRKSAENEDWATRFSAPVGKDRIFSNYPKETSDWARGAVNDPFSRITYGKAAQGVEFSRNQNINQQPAAAQQSFTQQEATVSANTSALIGLGTKIETLSSDLNNKEQASADEGAPEESFSVVQESLSNNSTAVNALTTNVQTLNASINSLINSISTLENEAGAQTNQQTPVQAPNTPAPSIGPFNTVVTPVPGGDFNTKIEEAINRLRSEIYTKLEIKTPPTQR
jgi:TP901 family phage tail tape measure protein